MGESTLEELAVEADELFKEYELKLVTAESCTGGLLGAALTGISGSSKYYVGGIIAYSNEIKMGLLNVCPETLGTHGAVSEETAKEMALGARNQACSAHDKTLGPLMAVSTTGIAEESADPEYPTEKDAGTVWIAVALGDEPTAKLFKFGAIGRKAVRQATVRAALNMIIKTLKTKGLD